MLEGCAKKCLQVTGMAFFKLLDHLTDAYDSNTPQKLFYFPVMPFMNC